MTVLKGTPSYSVKLWLVRASFIINGMVCCRCRCYNEVVDHLAADAECDCHKVSFVFLDGFWRDVLTRLISLSVSQSGYSGHINKTTPNTQLMPLAIPPTMPCAVCCGSEKSGADEEAKHLSQLSTDLRSVGCCTARRESSLQTAVQCRDAVVSARQHALQLTKQAGEGRTRHSGLATLGVRSEHGSLHTHSVSCAAVR